MQGPACWHPTPLFGLSLADCSPLAKSAAAFSMKAGQLQLGGSAGAHDDGGIPALHAPAPAMAAPAGSAWNLGGEQLRPTSCSQQMQHYFEKQACGQPPVLFSSTLPSTAAERGGPLDLPAPAPRIVVHRPSPSWFSPLMGFGGPSRVQWEEEQHAQEAARRRQQRQPALQRPPWVQPPHQTHPGRDCTRPAPAGVPPQQAMSHQPPPLPPQAAQHHRQAERPSLQQQQPAADPPQCRQPLAPLALEVAKLQELQLGSQQGQEQQRLAAERLLPWYQQGWHQQQPVPLTPQPAQQQTGSAVTAAAAVYPGGNPFANEPASVHTGVPQAALPARPGSSSGPAQPKAVPCNRPSGKLPPPPPFLLARRAQHQQPAPQHAPAQPAPLLPASEESAVQQHGLLQEQSASRLAAAQAVGVAADGVQPHPVSATGGMGSRVCSGGGSVQQPGTEGPQPAQAPAAHSNVEQQQQQGLPFTHAQPSKPATGPRPPPVPPPKPAGKGSARPGDAPAALPPAALAAAAGGSKAAQSPPAPPPPPKPAGAEAGALGTRPAPPQPAACRASALPPAGVSTLSAIQPAELLAASGRLGNVQAISGGVCNGSCPQQAAQAAPEEDARAQLMAAIRDGQFKLRKASAQPARPAQGAGGPCIQLGWVRCGEHNATPRISRAATGKKCTQASKAGWCLQTLCARLAISLDNMAPIVTRLMGSPPAWPRLTLGLARRRCPAWPLGRHGRVATARRGAPPRDG